MTAPMCKTHAMPVAECEGVRATRRWYTPVCLCGHPKAVHKHPHPGLDCGLCICGDYEAARRRRASRQAVWLGCASRSGVPSASASSARSLGAEFTRMAVTLPPSYGTGLAS